MKFAQSEGRVSDARPFKNATPRGRAARTLRLPTIRSVALCSAFAWASLTAATAMADVTITNPDATPNDNPEADLSIQAKPTGQWTGVWNRGNLLGDIGGLRPWLGKYGVSFALTETSEYLYNTRGGLNTGGTYDGLTTATVQLDTKKAFGLPGGLFNVSALNIHGQNLSADNLGTLNTASGI
jgi:porin